LFFPHVHPGIPYRPTSSKSLPCARRYTRRHPPLEARLMVLIWD
jgi:hypothetical protein